MPTRASEATWEGDLKSGQGTTKLARGLTTDADVPNITPKAFQEHANKAKTGCPVSKALAATQITLEARLVGQ